MSVLTVNELKARFASGDRPSQKDFTDFIDTMMAASNLAVNPATPGIALLYTTGALSGSTYTAVYSPPVASYLDGTFLAFKADLANPGTATYLDAGAGPQIILKQFALTLKAGDIQPGQIVEVRYNLALNAWLMVSPTSRPGHEAGDIITSSFPLAANASRLLCDGSSVDTNTYPGLVPLGIIYGIPSPNDGHHVKLPDYRARMPLGVGTLPSTTVVALGDVGGEENHLLLDTESGVASHTHDPLAGATGFLDNVASGGAGDDVGGVLIRHDATTGDVTGGAASAADSHNNLPPYIAAYFYILT
jgi:microcystin-dependent protein